MFVNPPNPPNLNEKFFELKGFAYFQHSHVKEKKIYEHQSIGILKPLHCGNTHYLYIMYTSIHKYNTRKNRRAISISL